ALYLLRQNINRCFTECQRLTEVVMGIRQTQCNYAVHGPRGQPPVEVGPHDGTFFTAPSGHGRNNRIVISQHDRFSDGPEDQTDTLAAGEEHRVPSESAVEGPGLGAPEPYLAKFAKGRPNTDQQGN